MGSSHGIPVRRCVRANYNGVTPEKGKIYEFSQLPFATFKGLDDE